MKRQMLALSMFLYSVQLVPMKIRPGSIYLNLNPLYSKLVQNSKNGYRPECLDTAFKEFKRLKFHDRTIKLLEKSTGKKFAVIDAYDAGIDTVGENILSLQHKQDTLIDSKLHTCWAEHHRETAYCNALQKEINDIDVQFKEPTSVPKFFDCATDKDGAVFGHSIKFLSRCITRWKH